MLLRRAMLLQIIIDRFKEVTPSNNHSSLSVSPNRLPIHNNNSRRNIQIIYWQLQPTIQHKIRLGITLAPMVYSRLLPLHNHHHILNQATAMRLLQILTISQTMQLLNHSHRHNMPSLNTRSNNPWCKLNNRHCNLNNTNQGMAPLLRMSIRITTTKEQPLRTGLIIRQ